MNKELLELWPEIEWIENDDLREKTARTWELALERSALTGEDLKRIPFTLLVKDCPASFMDHKRAVVHISRDSAKAMKAFFGDSLPIDMDTVVAGAILADVGKLLEYDLQGDGKAVVGMTGKYLRHPFTGVSLAMECGVPEAVCHIIAAHAGEGDKVTRTTEAYIVHHADFMGCEPFTTAHKWK